MGQMLLFFPFLDKCLTLSVRYLLVDRTRQPHFSCRRSDRRSRIAGMPEQTQRAPGNGQCGGSLPTRPSIDSRMRSAWPLWRAYSSIMLSRM